MCGIRRISTFRSGGNDSDAGSVNRSDVRAVANAEVISCLAPSICAMLVLRPYSLALEWCVQDFAVTGADDPDGLLGTVAVVVVISSGAKRKRERARRLSRSKNFRLRGI